MAYKGNTDAHRVGNMRYIRKFDSVTVRLPKGTRDKLQAIADEHNTSVNVVMKQIVKYALAHPEIIADPLD